MNPNRVAGGAPEETRSDAELVAAVRAGDRSAYGFLWARHELAARSLARQVARPSDVEELVSESFYRVLRAITGGGGPDGAFRPYLLSTLRRINIDVGRSYYQRVSLTADDEELATDKVGGADDVALENRDQSAAWRAWASLPEATRTLLWHLIVEEDTAAQLAPILGTTPNGVSSRAVRARERLRQAFLQQHVSAAATEECAATRARMGEYLRDAVNTADRRNVDDHLSTCESCPKAFAEIDDVNRTMRAVIAPLVLGGPLVAAGYVKAASHSHRLGLGARFKAARSRHPVAVVAAGVVAAALVAGGLVALTSPDTPGRGRPQSPSASHPTSSRPIESPIAPSLIPRVSVSRRPPPRSLAPTLFPSAEPPRVPVLIPTAPSWGPQSPSSPTPETGSTATRTVSPAFGGFGSGKTSVTFSVSVGWIIDSISGPSDSQCQVDPAGDATCQVADPTKGLHRYSLLVTGPSQAAGVMNAVWSSADGTRSAADFAF